MRDRIFDTAMRFYLRELDKDIPKEIRKCYELIAEDVMANHPGYNGWRRYRFLLDRTKERNADQTP